MLQQVLNLGKKHNFHVFRFKYQNGGSLGFGLSCGNVIVSEYCYDLNHCFFDKKGGYFVYHEVLRRRT